MHSGRSYKLTEFLMWTRRDIYILTVLAIIPTILYAGLDIKWVGITWVPVALLGTAAAFIAGFRNNATYARAWEARQIWGAIVNTSRSWGVMSRDFVSKPGASSEELKQIHKDLVYRHIAWLTALRFQLREKRTWENMDKSYNIEYLKYFTVDEWVNKLEDELKEYLSAEEFNYVLKKKNRATQIIALQSAHLKRLADDGFIENNRYVELELLLKDLYDSQGKCERIKNYPYPRQFATINTLFIWLFIFMVPFGMVKEFDKLGNGMAWLTIPFSVIVMWVFTSLERVGESTENPFEGSANDVPITALSRTIEIDLREMLDETDLPAALQPVNSILT
ncbi:MAG: multidrug transporter [Sphingobacteriales bacterium JAD_PAG50586_3]|nr:MAG: multidrug transporter [Sphingobacteriales bacterium JAD_PAG50586_3]